MEAFDGDPSASDAASLACVVTMREILADRCPKNETHIICEILDPATERMLQRNAKLRMHASFFHSNALETGLFAMASADPAVFNTILRLLDPDDDTGFIDVPVDDYLGRDE